MLCAALRCSLYGSHAPPRHAVGPLHRSSGRRARRRRRRGRFICEGPPEDAAERDGFDADVNVFTSAPEHWYSALSGVFFRDDAIDGGETRPMNEPSDRGVDGGDGVRGVGVHDVRHNGHRTQATLSKSSLERVLAHIFDLNSEADVRKTRRWRPKWFAGRDNT